MPENQGEAPTTPLENSTQVEETPYESEVRRLFQAMEMVHQKAVDPARPGFDGRDVLAINSQIMDGSLNPHLYGTLRRGRVKVSVMVRGQVREASFVPPDPQELPELFKDFSGKLGLQTAELHDQSGVAATIETAAWAHNELIKIHPFSDGNGRTARLLVDFIFKRAGLPYLTDWGVEDDEYLDVVDRTFKENNGNLFKTFLAQKLIYRCDEDDWRGSELEQAMAELRAETTLYLHTLSSNAS